MENAFLVPKLPIEPNHDKHLLNQSLVCANSQGQTKLQNQELKQKNINRYYIVSMLQINIIST